METTNSEIFVHYSGHKVAWVMNNKVYVRYSSHDLNEESFDDLTVFNPSNTKLVRYSDLHCIPYQLRIHFFLFVFVDCLVQFF